MPSPLVMNGSPSMETLVICDGPRLTINNLTGLGHERQVIEIPAPPGSQKIFAYHCPETGMAFLGQRCLRDSTKAFLELTIAPHFSGIFHLTEEGTPSTLHVTGEKSEALIVNDQVAIRIPLGQGTGPVAPGPVCGFGVSDRSQYGHTFFDLATSVKFWDCQIVESGPIRIVWRFGLETLTGGKYEATFTLDNTADFVRIEEHFDLQSGDQLVWVFDRNNLPHEMFVLDHTAGGRPIPLTYFHDRRVRRVAAWTQFSQFPEVCDGFALSFPDSQDVVGFVALNGGSWQGNQLNFIEGWSRRWMPDDPGTRRLVPSEAKADSAPNPDRIQARVGTQHQAAFFCEAWIGRGSRVWALAAGLRSSLLLPSQPNSKPKRSGGITWAPDFDAYEATRVRLREIHTRHGVFPLSLQKDLVLQWPEEPEIDENPAWLSLIVSHLEKASSEKAPGGDPAVVQHDYLASRLFGFWCGSGSADANPVWSRRIAPEMLHYGTLRSSLSQKARLERRAWFAFFAELFFSDNYYPGPATMEPPGEPRSFEPTIAGMANQNFFTEAIVIAGMAGEVFHKHPRAEAWRQRFVSQWERQLAYHCYEPSGVWEESHTYFLHVLHTVFPLLLRMKESGSYDAFCRADLQRLLGSLVAQRSPEDDVLADGHRYLVPFGDHDESPEWLGEICRNYALYVAETNDKLAKSLLWLAGTPCAECPPAESESVTGIGFFFRSDVPPQGESLLALRSGGAWGHHHNDEGCIFFHAYRRPMIVDAGFGRHLPEDLKHSAKGHSRRASDGIQPIHHLWRWSRGFVVESKTDGPVPYVHAVIPTRLQLLPDGRIVPCEREQIQTRTILQLHPTIYLIIDQSSDDAAETTRFHLPLGEISAQPDGVITRWQDGVVLTIRSLFASQPPVLCEHQPAGKPLFSTTEVAFKAESKREIFLVCAHDKCSMEIKRREGKFLISLDEPLFEFLPSQDSLSVWNLKTSSFTLIPLPPQRLPA